MAYLSLVASEVQYFCLGFTILMLTLLLSFLYDRPCMKQERKGKEQTLMCLLLFLLQEATHISEGVGWMKLGASQEFYFEHGLLMNSEKIQIIKK